VKILGADRVTGIVVERTRRPAPDQVAGSGERFVLPAGMVVTAVGFRGAPLAGEGVVPGVYVAGWLKRGANGIIGTNRPDGAETAAAVLADLAGRAVPARPDVVDLLAARNRLPSDWAGWLRLEEYEGALGAAAGRGRVKVHDLESMLRCCATTMRQ
jgi:ferredoxin--NADP+ reductase